MAGAQLSSRRMGGVARWYQSVLGGEEDWSCRLVEVTLIPKSKNGKLSISNFVTKLAQFCNLLGEKT